MKLKGRKALGFPANVWNHSGTVQVLKGLISRRQSGAIGVPRKSREQRDQPKVQQTCSSPRPQHLGSEQEQMSALSDLLLKNPFVRAEDLLRGSLTCAGICPARGKITKGTHHQFGLLQPSSHTLTSQEGLHITMSGTFIAMGVGCLGTFSCLVTEPSNHTDCLGKEGSSEKNARFTEDGQLGHYVSGSPSLTHILSLFTCS